MPAQSRISSAHPELHQPGWSLARRLAFRFCFVYFGLFCLSNMLGALYPAYRVDDEVGLATLWPIRQITFWTAHHIFAATLPLVYRNSGSDDKTFDWVLVFCLLIFALLATLVWSVLDRERTGYTALHKWFRLFLRFMLASELFYFGMAKVIPNQMSVPSLSWLLQPIGEWSTRAMLWLSIGASPAYEIFTGCAEVLGAALLIFPRTAMLGALVCLADMTEVWMLNMTYGVPVKLFSFHLLLISLLLLAPDFQRIGVFLWGSRAVEPPASLRLFKTLRANRLALAAQILLGLWLIARNAQMHWDFWHHEGSGHPKSALYGIWDVEEISLNGPTQPDYRQWRRVVFDFPDRITVQQKDDSFARYGASIDLNKTTIDLTKAADKSWKAKFAFKHSDPDHLFLDEISGTTRIHMNLRLADKKKMRLLDRSFHWVQEY